MGALAGCALHNARQVSPEDKLGISGQMLEERKLYKDEALSFRLPASWTAKALAEKDPLVHAVGIECPAGLHCRITLLRNAAEDGAFAAEVVRSLKEAHPELHAEPHRARFAAGEARGFRYTFKNERGSWQGWVVSATQGGVELGFLGQFPKGTHEKLQEALTEMMHSLGRTLPPPPDSR